MVVLDRLSLVYGLIAFTLFCCEESNQKSSAAISSTSGDFAATTSGGTGGGVDADNQSNSADAGLDNDGVGGSSAIGGGRGPSAETGSDGATDASSAGTMGTAGTASTIGTSGGAGGSGGTAGAASDADAGTARQDGSKGVTDSVVEVLDIAQVWSGHPVGFFLLTHDDRQFVAFYDQDRRLTVAERTLGSESWKFVRLSTSVGWDSHNNIVLAIDDEEYIHLSGNMHSSPLIYFRTASPLDIDTFERHNSMVGINEQSCTYPQFFRSPDGELVFMYRDGASGNGNHIFNIYHTETRSWERLLGTSLTDGEGLRNAYPVGPVQGPNNLWHLVWVWRDTPDASTNHDLSYARTADLVNWQKASGQAIRLPITLSTGDIVDPVPSYGGMINNNTKVGFDSQQRPVVAYHKYDVFGNIQLYNARFENGSWVVYQTSQWDYRWDFGGVGTLVFEIEVEPVQLQSDGTLTQTFYHAHTGGLGAFRLDEETLRAVETISPPVPYPVELSRVESTIPEMEVRWQEDTGAGPIPDVIYMLRWETLPLNRDMQRPWVPPPTPLRLYGFHVDASSD